MGVIDRIKMASSILVGGGAATSGTLADFIGGTMTGRQRTPKELLDAYSQLPWLHATANKVSMSVASTTWRVYRPTSTPEGARSTPQREKAIKLRAKVDREVNRADNPLARTKAIKRLLTEGEIEEVDNHPILDLLYDGNDFMTGSTVRQLTQVYQDVVGEAFLMYERGAGGVPIALLPVPRTWVEKIATPDQPTYIISHDSYREEFDASEIVYFQAPNLRDPYGRGVGTAAALNDELATDEYAAKHTRKWFENSARPDLIVTGPGLEKAETRRLENKWRAKFQGFKNSFAPAFLSTEVKIHELNQTFQSMQLRELREFERDTIIQVYGVPPEILGIVENSNRATIEAADYLYGRWVVAPRCEYTREVLQVRVMDVEFDGAILAYDSPVAEDKTHQLEVAKAAPYSLKIDEWREMMGLEPLDNDEGQVFMMPFNLVPQTSPALVPSTPDPIAPPDDEEDPDDVDDDDDDDQADDDETTDDDEAVVEETARGGRTKRDEGDGTLTEEDVLLLASRK
jgi:HK97 family phage portal protein